MCTDANRDVVRSSRRRKYDMVVVRDGGEVLVFPLPKRGEDFERAPAGPLQDRYINDPNVDIHVDIITDDEGVVAYTLIIRMCVRFIEKPYLTHYSRCVNTQSRYS